MDSKKTKVLEFFLNRLVEFVYKYTSRFAISGEGFKKRIIPYLKCEKEILYAPNWADQLNTNLEPFKFSEGDKINFTFAGNIGKVQNLDNIIKAFGMLPKKYLNNAQLNIIGDGSELNNLRGATEKSMFNNIVFLGRKPREEMYKYLKGSDFLIVSLIKEPIFSLTVPAKVQTYIASYKPIIAIMDGDACDLIKNNDLGLTAQPDDVKEIQNIIIQAINMDKNKIQEFTKNSERLTKTVFNKNIIISDLLNLTVKDRV